jgi:glyoxylase-like metal-dependent hydrolase (beta-lactamase superfamily II)
LWRSSWAAAAVAVASALLLPALPAAAQSASPPQLPSVGVYTSPARTFTTASYWLVGPSGTLLVDTQFLPAEGLLAARAAAAAGGKTVSHALVLHPNPDKFNGTAALQAQGVQVATSAQVLREIPAVHRIRLGWFADDFKPDYPAQAAQPQAFGASSQVVSWAGLTVQLHVLGAGCSAAHVVAQATTTEGNSVFVGDLVNPNNHAWLELGRIDDWLQRLADIQALRPDRVYPGRGAPGGPELLAQQAEYLRFVQNLVQAQQPRGSLGWFTKLRLQNAIEQRYPQLGYPGFMRDGLAAVWAVEATKLAAATAATAATVDTGPQKAPAP